MTKSTYLMPQVSVENMSLHIFAGLFADEQTSFSALYGSTSKQDTSYKSMRVLKYASEYQLILSLLVANPEDAIVTWDIEGTTHEYIMPLLNRISNISDFTVNFQIENYAALSIEPDRKVYANGSTVYTFNPKALSNFINSAEWNLASVVSSAPPVHLILYTPPESRSPLYILHSDGRPVETNSFLIPQWGGIAIRSIPKGTKLFHYSRQELHPIMEIFLGQLRDLMGIEPTRIKNSATILPNVVVDYVSSKSAGITTWELDRLSRTRTIQNLLNAVQTLNSLATLLEQLGNMVVLDHIQTLVTHSLDSLHRVNAFVTFL